MPRKRKYDVRGIPKDSKLIRKELSISRYGRENSKVQKIIYISKQDDPYQWTIVLHPSVVCCGMYYFKVYDSSVSLKNSTHCVAISIDCPVYYYPGDYSKPHWVLNDNEKQFLCKIIDEVGWDNILNSISELLKTCCPDAYIHNMRYRPLKPNYMELPNEEFLKVGEIMPFNKNFETRYWFGLSRELTEHTEIQTFIYGEILSTNKWVIYMYPPVIRNDILYFIIYNYDNEPIDPTRIAMCNAKKMARISMTSPEYIYCKDCSKEQWILNADEKKILCEFLRNRYNFAFDSNWDYLKYSYAEEINYYDDRGLDLTELPMPDYMQLPE